MESSWVYQPLLHPQSYVTFTTEIQDKPEFSPCWSPVVVESGSHSSDFSADALSTIKAISYIRTRIRVRKPRRDLNPTGGNEEEHGKASESPHTTASPSFSTTELKSKVHSVAIKGSIFTRIESKGVNIVVMKIQEFF